MTPFPRIALMALALSACTAPIPPVEVTRFHTGGLSERGSVSIAAGEGLSTESLEFRTYAMAVSRELVRLGFAESAGTGSTRIAEVSFTRGTLSKRLAEPPVSVGVGGGTGGVGIGIGIPIGSSNRTRETVITRLSVRLLNRADGKPVWEGRAETSAPATAPAAQPGLAADKLAKALFADFPGQSGATITVR